MREWTPAECQDYLRQGAGNQLLRGGLEAWTRELDPLLATY